MSVHPKLLLLASALLALVSPAARAADAPAPPAGSAGPQEAKPALSGVDVGGVTFQPSGWLVMNAYSNRGGFAVDTNTFGVRFAGAPSSDRGLNATARQSRLRLNIGLPSDGLLGGTVMKGFIEADFAGASSSAVDQSMYQPRLRHAYVTATWASLGDLTLLVGQTWSVLGGPVAAVSLSHLAMPRFAGAGQLFRRAPQVRLQGVVPAAAALSFAYQAAAIAPVGSDGTVASTANGVGAALPSETGAEHSNTPQGEARVAAIARPSPRARLELGVSSHYGRETYALNGISTTATKTVDSLAYVLDARLDVPYLTLQGQAFTGRNLDILTSAAPGVIFTTNGAGARTDVADARTRGLWAQAVVKPLPLLQLLGGFGVEAPAANDAGHPFGATAVAQSRQLSTGAIVNLTSRWQAGLEFTRYFTRYGATGSNRQDSSQVELSTLFSL